MTRRAKWIAWTLAGLAAALLLTLLVFEALRWPGIGHAAQWAVERSSGWPSRFEGCQARLLGRATLDCTRVTLGADEWVDARQAHLSWRWGDLWHWRRGGDLRLRALRAQSLSLALVRDAAGRASWQPPRQRAQGTASENDGDPHWPVVDELLVERGRLDWRDAQTDTQLRMTTESTERGGWQAHAEGRWRALDVSLDARSASLLPLLAARPGAALVPLTLSGRAGQSRLAFDGRAAALLGARDLDGRVELAGPSLDAAGTPLGLTLPHTPPFELRGQLAHSGGVWKLTRTQATIGRSDLGGDFSFDTRTRPGTLGGRLAGRRLVLQDLAPTIGAGGPRERGARLLPDRPFDLPSLRAMHADLELAIDEFDLGAQTLAPLRALRTHVRLRDGSLQLDPLSAAVAGGRVQGRTRLDAPGDEAAAQWRLALGFDGIELASALRTGRSPGGVAPRQARRTSRKARNGKPGDEPPAPAYITGRLVGELDLHGRGRSTATILSSLDGRADVTVREGTLSHLMTEAIGLDVAQAIGVAVRGDRALPLRCARVRLAVDDGVATLRQAVLDNRDSTVRMAGEVNLAKETLSVVMRARPKDLSPLSLRAPVQVTGPWRAPKVGIEGKRIAGRVAGAVALGAALGPLAALLPLIDPGEKPPGDPCATPSAAPAAAASAPR